MAFRWVLPIISLTLPPIKRRLHEKPLAHYAMVVLYCSHTNAGRRVLPWVPPPAMSTRSASFISRVGWRAAGGFLRRGISGWSAARHSRGHSRHSVREPFFAGNQDGVAMYLRDLLPTVLLASALLPAAADEAQLGNRERLSGTILGMKGNKLRFGSDALGEVQVPWRLVRDVRSDNNLAVYAEGGKVLVGVLSGMRDVTLHRAPFLRGDDAHLFPDAVAHPRQRAVGLQPGGLPEPVGDFPPSHEQRAVALVPAYRGCRPGP